LRQVARSDSKVHPLSGVTGAGVTELLERLLAALLAERVGTNEAEAEATTHAHSL